jgi:hypothetical protein
MHITKGDRPGCQRNVRDTTIVQQLQIISKLHITRRRHWTRRYPSGQQQANQAAG